MGEGGDEYFVVGEVPIQVRSHEGGAPKRA